MLQKIFFTVIAAFLFFILITKIAFAVINGDNKHDHDDDNQRSTVRDLSKEFINLKTEKISSSSSKRKGKKKVRFAVDHDAFVVNKVVVGPSETKQVVFEKDHHDQELIRLNDVGSHDQELKEKEVFGDIETEKSDYDQIKGGKIEPNCEENVANCDDEGLIRMKLMCDDGNGIDEGEKEKEGLISDDSDDSDDDWEGVERSDLEKVFAMAVDYGKIDDNLGNLESDIQMQLYGLHKVATEGPCYEPQPMALKVFARAKWNAWQKLGNMNPDVAMEQYITLLSEKVPGWSQPIHSHSLETHVSSSITTSILDTSHKERMESCSDVGDLIGVSDSINEDKQ